MDQNTGDIIAGLDFIKRKVEDLPTREEVKEIVEEIVAGKLLPIESKLSGIERRLDSEAIRRDDEKLPPRVSDLEQKVFGKSRAPQQQLA